MCSWKNWILPGLVIVALLSALAGFTTAGRIGGDLAGAAAAGLTESHSWARVEASARDLRLTGNAPSPEAAADAMRIAAGTAGVRAVEDRTALLPLADPYRLAVRFKDGALLLEGHVPDDATRNALLEAVKAGLPDATVDARLELARGAPEGFPALAAHVLGLLPGLAEGTIELSGDDLGISGVVRSPGDFDSVTRTLSTLPSGRLAALDLTPAGVEPYTWSLRRTSDGVVFEGFAPSPAARDALLRASGEALPAGIAVENRMLVAAGVPPSLDWAEAAGFLAALLPRLSEGAFAIAGTELTFEGRAATPQAYEELASALGRDLPGGLTLAGATLRQPLIVPYDWLLSPGADGAVVLSGHVPDRETGARLVDAARRAGASEVEDRQRLGAGAPDGFEQALSAALAVAMRLEGGRVELSGGRLTVAGQALTGPAANELRSSLARSAPPGIELDAVIGTLPVGPPVSPQDCQARLDATFARGAIGFETGSAEILPGSFGLLDRLAYDLRHCPSAVVEIGGHTDSEGADDANLALSQARADAVKAYLARAGVLPGKLQARGFGETEPRAGNDTPEGRAQNRRIEFRITG